MRPSPEQWWQSLNETDRQAYMEAAKRGRLTQELFEKMAAAGIRVPQWTFGDDRLEYYVPHEYVWFVNRKRREAEGTER